MTGGGGGDDDDDDDDEGNLAVRMSYLLTNVFRRTTHYARVWFRTCWLLHKRSDEREWAPAYSKLRDTNVPRIGRYDEISMQDQLASASRMSAAN